MKKTTKDLFENFTKEVLKEHKNNIEAYKHCVNVYKQAQLYDMSYIVDNTYCNYMIQNDILYINNIQYNLPFDNIFIKINDYQAIFLRYYDNFRIAGCFYSESEEIKGKMPFTINNNLFLNKVFCVLNYEANKNIQELIFKYIAKINDILQTMINKTVILDTPKEIKHIKNSRKNPVNSASKPIYIILNKEKHNKKYIYDKIYTKGVLTRVYSFMVCGHWRKLNNTDSLGKDRNGIYNIKGYTWIKPYIKGNKENIINKERICKVL